MSIVHDTLYNEHGHWVADSFINGKLWVIHSDYGTVGYRWHAIGEKSLKEFLAMNPLRRENDYLLKKLWSEPLKLHEPDWPGTRLALWKYLVECIRESYYKDVDWAWRRMQYDALRLAESWEDYQSSTDSSDEIRDAWEFIQRRVTDSAQAFHDEALIPLTHLFWRQLQDATDTKK